MYCSAQDDVVAAAEPAEMAADEVRPGVRQRGGRSLEVARNVFAEVEVVDGHPAGVDDVDQHQGVVIGKVDEDVVRRVVGAMRGQLDALTGNLKGVAVLEGHLRRRAGRVVVAQQQPPGLLMAMRTTFPSNSEDAPAWSSWWWE